MTLTRAWRSARWRLDQSWYHPNLATMKVDVTVPAGTTVYTGTVGRSFRGCIHPSQMQRSTPAVRTRRSFWCERRPTPIRGRLARNRRRLRRMCPTRELARTGHGGTTGKRWLSAMANTQFPRFRTTRGGSMTIANLVQPGRMSDKRPIAGLTDRAIRANAVICGAETIEETHGRRADDRLGFRPSVIRSVGVGKVASCRLAGLRCRPDCAGPQRLGNNPSKTTKRQTPRHPATTPKMHSDPDRCRRCQGQRNADASRATGI